MIVIETATGGSMVAHPSNKADSLTGARPSWREASTDFPRAKLATAAKHGTDVVDGDMTWVTKEIKKNRAVGCQAPLVVVY